MKMKNPYNICTWDEKADCTNCNNQEKLACKWDKKILSGFHAIGFPPLLIAIFGMVLVGILTGIWWFLIAYVIYFPVMLIVFEGRSLCSHCPYWAEDSKTLHCLANHGNPKLWRYHPKPMNKFEQFMLYFYIATIFFVFPLAAMGYGIWDMGYGIWDMGYGIWDMGYGIWDMGYGIWDMGYGIWDMGYGIWDMGYGIWDMGYGIWFTSIHYVEYGLISLLGLIGITVASLLTSVTLVAVLKVFFCSKCVNFSCPLNTVSKPVIDEYLKKNDVMRKAWEKSGYVIES